MKTIAYIIGFRSTDQCDRRLENLILTLQWLIDVKQKLYFDNIKLKIIVIEQDSTSKITIPKNIDCHIQYLFIYNNGCYNKGWLFNVGYFHFNANYYFFADGDIVMKTKHIINVFKTCFKYEAVNPYSTMYDSTEEFVSDASFNPLIWKDPTNLQKRENTCFSGGIVGLKDHAVKSISGWDERFRGQCWEDYAFTAKINLFLYSIYIYPYYALHIWHPFKTNTLKTINADLNEQYSRYDFYDYVNVIEKASIGYIIKYSTNIPIKYKSTYKICNSRYYFAKNNYNNIKKNYKKSNKIYLMLSYQINQPEKIEEDKNSKSENIKNDDTSNIGSLKNFYETPEDTFEFTNQMLK